MSESIPNISFDLDIGKLFSEVDINQEALVRYMREQGIDDEAIDNTSIHIKADNTLYKDQHGEVRAINGAYYAKSGVIALFPYRIAHQFSLYAQTVADVDTVEAIRQQMNGFWSEEFSNILKHELAHKKRRIALQEEGKQTHNELTARELARTAMSQEGYENDAEEAECHAEAACGPKNLLSFQLRASSYSEVIAVCEELVNT